MRYTTEFYGEFKINKKVDKKTYDLLKGIAETRRIKRGNLPKKYGVEGEFYCKNVDDFGQSKNPNEGKIINYSIPPKTQPSLYCQWLIQKDRQTIQWNGGEKFYNYIEWIKYLIKAILKPRGYFVNGEVEWQGEKPEDFGKIIIKNNVITIKNGRKVFN